MASQRLKTLRASVMTATDALLWFIAYWSTIDQGGATGDHLKELRKSCELDPFEGWIALRSQHVLAGIWTRLAPICRRRRAGLAPGI
jgi:hypothetical protein